MNGVFGFVNAPVVKALFATTTGSSILWQAARFDFVEPLNPLLSSFVRMFVFRNTGELIFGAGLMYYFRILERQTGSTKFAGYSFVATTLSYGLQKAFELAYGFEKMPSGPYGFVFASLVQFIFDIPPSHRFRLFGIPLSDKAFTYLMGLQLMFSNGMGSVMAALCGVLAGFTYRSNIFKLRKFRFPTFVNRILARTIGRLLGSSPRRPIVTMHATRRNRRRPQAPINNRAAAVQPVVRRPVSDEAVQQLIAMGFDESQARTALQVTNNDVQSAIAMLVDQA